MSDILADTVKLLQRTKLTRREIAEQTGLGKDWLDALALGSIHDPGVRKIEKLHRFLSEPPADTA